ncbi:DUF2726 domain-containing protein [Planctomycetes bacterium K23_9]|uniref:DUF2726 domain-containing protein n=1 Tax=Stieleria marina TaxID=1930275 RepID=A0A517NP47_9BACT|nr:hypothetical protein K239x_08390 [Planctomycetes bacterium K23_9]
MIRYSYSQMLDATLRLCRVRRGTESDAAEQLPTNESLALSQRANVLSESHALLYRALANAMGTDCAIFAKSRLSDFLALRDGGKDLKLAIKMDRKYVDFMLCDPSSMQPIAAVQLVLNPKDKPGARPPVDPFIAQALRAAGIKLLRIDARKNYCSDELRKALLPKVSACVVTSELSATEMTDRSGNASDSSTQPTTLTHSFDSRLQPGLPASPVRPNLVEQTISA